MSDCCCPNAPAKTAQDCPECGSACKSVGMPTLYHQVRFPENQRIASDTYYFCPSKQCTTAYFSIAGNSIPKQHLRTYQEIQNDKLCYCFDIDTDQYLSAISANHAESIKDFVIQRTKSGECACEFRNPSGQCCLAKFKHFDK
jgi:hypothetical protein